MTSISDMDHENLVVVHYNEYAGGKFFINCLGHHVRVLPGINLYYRFLNEGVRFETQSDDDIRVAKIQQINASIPPLQDIKNWNSYELGCDNFWGDPLWKFLKGKNASVPFHGGVAALQKYVCFIVNHTLSMCQFEKINQIWPKSKHVILYNSDEFRALSLQFKSHQKHLIGSNALAENLPRSYYVDVDQTWVDTNKVRSCAQDCVRWLGLVGDMHENLDQYITKYINLHLPLGDRFRANS